jgi:pSer/pThr/pTyr-binding forkhead associated (FHA) protein
MSTSTTHPTPQLERPTLEHGVPGSALARHPALVLSHRSWSHAVREQLARPGRYLALDAGTTSLLLGLERDVTHIGRGLTADIQLEDQRVSRQHAIVLRRGASFVIVDDRSACGTFVNGDRVSEAELHDGDEIVLGPVRLRFVEIARRPLSRARPQISRRRALAPPVASF